MAGEVQAQAGPLGPGPGRERRGRVQGQAEQRRVEVPLLVVEDGADVHALALADRDVVEQVLPGEGRAGEVAAPRVAQDAGVVAVGVAVGPDLVHEVAPLGRAVADGDGEAEGDGREREPARRDGPAARATRRRGP